MATTKTNTKFKAPTTYGTAVVYLNKIFDLCNDKYFEGELTRPTITIQSTPKAYGHVTVAEVWENESNGKAVTHHELNIGADTLKPYQEMIERLRNGFHGMYLKAQMDKTLRTDEPEEKLFSKTIHLMLAAVTRYAVGLVYIPESGFDAMEELEFLKKLILEKYKA